MMASRIVKPQQLFLDLFTLGAHSLHPKSWIKLLLESRDQLDQSCVHPTGCLRRATNRFGDIISLAQNQSVIRAESSVLTLC